jgi:SAM-dependent methyltransferase
MPIADKELLMGGSYAKKQIFCKDWIVAWSHRSRYQLARQLVRPYSDRRLLDYGCGDGTFLALVHDLFAEAVGVDEDLKQTAECVSRFAGLTGLSFMLTDDLVDCRHTGAYEVIVCMEVLEHCVEEKLVSVLSDLRRLLPPDGTVIISVPIEVGLSLLAKQVVRTLAGWRGLGDYMYNERYAGGELLKMVFAGEQTTITRPVYRADFAPNRPNLFYGHKGFNWRTLRARLGKQFTVQQTLFSPMGWLGGYLSSQAWFICTPR